MWQSLYFFHNMRNGPNKAYFNHIEKSYLWWLCASKKQVFQEANDLQVEVMFILLTIWSTDCERWAANKIIYTEVTYQVCGRKSKKTHIKASDYRFGWKEIHAITYLCFHAVPVLMETLTPEIKLLPKSSFVVPSEQVCITVPSACPARVHNWWQTKVSV